MAAPTALAEVTDLADWIGEPIEPSSAEGKRAALCLRLASALVRKEAGRTWVKEDGTLDDPPEEAHMVTLYCASRVFDNREAQTRGGIDDFQEGWKVDEAGAYLTVSEKRMLAPFRGGGHGGLGTVATTRGGFIDSTTVFVPTNTPDVLFPWY